MGSSQAEARSVDMGLVGIGMKRVHKVEWTGW